MSILILILSWVAIGLGVEYIEYRRGKIEWETETIICACFLGPLIIPLIFVYWLVTK